MESKYRDREAMNGDGERKKDIFDFDCVFNREYQGTVDAAGVQCK